VYRKKKKRIRRDVVWFCLLKVFVLLNFVGLLSSFIYQKHRHHHLHHEFCAKKKNSSSCSLKKKKKKTNVAYVLVR